MTEIDVAVTDYAITILTCFFASRFSQREGESSQLKKLWLWFFATIALASAAGGTVHGFFVEPNSPGRAFLWPLTTLAIGATAWVGWVIAGLMVFGAAKIRQYQIFASVIFVVYAGVLLFFSQKFIVVIGNYLPAMLALMAASIWVYQKNRKPRILYVALGILTSFFAAYVQVAGLGIHPEYFNHNSTFHFVQAWGFFFIFKGALSSIPTVQV